jgi:hypothetical protein
VTRGWCWATAPLIVAGACWAFLQFGAGAVLVVVAFAGSVIGFAVWALQPEQPMPRPTAGTVATGLLGGLGLLGLIGWVAAVGAAGLVVCALIVTTGVLVLRARRRPRAATDEPRRPPPPSGAPPRESLAEGPLPLPHTLGELSTADVCWAWRVSYLRVRRPGCPGYEVAFLTELRSACLDELERRDPAAFSRWLPAARAAADPARAFCPESRQR